MTLLSRVTFIFLAICIVYLHHQNQNKRVRLGRLGPGTFACIPVEPSQKHVKVVISGTTVTLPTSHISVGSDVRDGAVRDDTVWEASLRHFLDLYYIFRCLTVEQFNTFYFAI